MKSNFATEKTSKIYQIRRLLQVSLTLIFSNELLSKLYFRIKLKKKLNLSNPCTFNEKIQWYKLYYCKANKNIIQCSDKYKVRVFVENKGFKDILNPLIGTWNSVEQIDWSTLPDKFVIKCNHGCGYNYICRDKKSLNIPLVSKLIKKWMNEDFGLFNIEPHYDKIQKKIICEKYIETKSGELPNDFKIYYFGGVPKIILVTSEREKKLMTTFFDLDWKRLDIGRYEPDTKLVKPKLISQAIETGKDLAKDFPFVRIDFYDCEESVIFGEMSFTVGAGLADYYSNDGDEYVGRLFNLKDIK